ncbi:immunoglobulin superfamily member 3 [Kryptolebias marmoratus]|uniref:Immunoglobulin superfamily, member 3-like n=1 Tax=Kryptolebias marmoratus TaxID=37003 RepID=A0A3Q3B4W4_KRYMA|nr:immunoglobulin superfamily member 3 [Kryptolebias marmoratus]
MACSLSSMWGPTLLLWMGLLLHCEAKVHTEIQTGPLYRVEGSQLFISCNVSGFKDEMAEKIFEFRVIKPARPNFEINIISTGEEDFGYASHQRRVLQNDISLIHVNPNSARFQIQNLLKDDEGDYDCKIKNTESTFDGTYSAITTVKVIDNSLSVSSSESATSLNYNQGETLTLTCQASSNTIQHTHLSFTWYLHKDEQSDAQPIISLDRYFTLSPGQGFEQRYQEGDISLDKLGEATYQLKMAQLEVSDQGKIYCQAQEWIQDPDRSWYMISQSQAEAVTLTVKAREVTDMSSLEVRMAAEQTTLEEGEELQLSCSIDTQNMEARFFTVVWLWRNIELARIGPTGVLAVKPSYSSREKEGELRVTRIQNQKNELRLKPVRTADQGEYGCRAWLEERDSNGAFTQGTTKDSSPLLITISSAESELSVTMQDVPTSVISVIQREKLRLVCKVGGSEGRLSVIWQRKPIAQTDLLFTKVISLNQDGVMETAAAFESRKVRAMRQAADVFVFELDEVTPSDSGVYQCTVTELKTNGKTHSQSQSASVTVNTIESLVKVSLINRHSEVTMGENVELVCNVKGPPVPSTLSWSVQTKGSSLNTIVTLVSDGSISWSGNQHQYQVKVRKQKNLVMYSLIIIGASYREAGSYQCLVSVFLENVYKKLTPSNEVSVTVRNPENKLALSFSPKILQSVNTDIQMNCKVSSSSSPSSLYAVTWLYLQGSVNKTILSSDQYAVVTFGDRVEQNDKQRISMKRKMGLIFELTIRQARLTDRGLYQCKVEEWLQGPRGDWYSLPAKFAQTNLNITEPENDLILDNKQQELKAREGDEVELRCNSSSGASGLYYKVTWFYAPSTSLSMNSSLVELDHTGLLTYPQNQELMGLQGRLHLSRPTQNIFYLRIQRAHESDSGNFWCQVEQYQPDDEGRWNQKASKSSGPITLTVLGPDAKLSLDIKDVEMNISKAENFDIPCHITQQSSDKAQFQVTWFWKKGTEPKRPIFIVYRNSTLQAISRKDTLKFSHPLPNEFTLTVLKPGSEDSGLYFCEVEEWLPSLSHGWKVAKRESGHLNVTVYAEGNIQASSECTSATLIVPFVVIVAILLLVIFVLVLKICKSSEGKKLPPSLWVDQHLMKDKEEL